MTSNENPKIKIKETEPFLYRFITLSKDNICFYFRLIFRLLIKKNNIEWLENDTKIHYSVERIFTRDQVFSDKLLEQEGAFVDILRAVS